MKITEKIFDISTGEETFIEREETKAEKDKREALEAEVLTKQAEAEARAQAKVALLAQLGITEEQAKLLLS